jgi:predicted aconitase
VTLHLDAVDERRLKGEEGPALEFAMRILVKAATIMGAERLIPISFAHLDACFYTGQAHIDFVSHLLSLDAKLAVPTWTNNGVASLTDPEFRAGDGDRDTVSGARKLMELYARLGAKPTFTCAPYQLPGGPGFGDHIAVGESNAVSFYNSIIGARTNKYGDYLDVACAIAGKAPHAGLHLDENRRAELHIDCSALPESWRSEEIFAHLLGHHIGKLAGRRVPVVTGLLPGTSRDALKAISAAVASSGGVELWHGVGVTPEAPTLDAIFRGGPSHVVRAEDLRSAQQELSTLRDGPLDAVAVGTPHFSFEEFARLMPMLAGRRVKSGTRFYVSTSRGVRQLIEAKGWLAELERAGVEIPVDVCTYYSPKIQSLGRRVMTNSAKWAYYAPGMLGVEVAFGSLRECVESAIRGEVWRDPTLWLNA